MEIKVEFHEGAIPLSTLLVLYGSHLACSLLSVRFFFCLLILSFFVGHMGEV